MTSLVPTHPLTARQQQRHLQWREAYPWQQFFLGLALLVGAQFFSFGLPSFFSHFYATQAGSRHLAEAMLCAGLLLGAGISYFGFGVILRWRAGRPAWEISTRGAVRELGIGLLVGATAVSAPILVLWALGMYHVSGVRFSTDIAVSAAIGIGAAFTEEVFLRGFVLRLTERAVGTVAALVFSSLIFGLGHLGNADTGLWGAIAIGLEAGTLLGAAYLYTRRLWLAIGIHAAWNAVQGGIWSSAISGTGARQGLFIARFDGPVWLTGGVMGIEGSLLAIGSCLVVATWLLFGVYRRHLFVTPSNWPWRWHQARPFAAVEQQ